MKEKLEGVISPKERIKNFNEFHIPLCSEEQQKAGRKMYGLRCTVLSVWYDDRRYGIAAVR